MIEIKVTFENYFGEDLLEVMLFRKMASHTIYDIKDKEKKLILQHFMQLKEKMKTGMFNY